MTSPITVYDTFLHLVVTFLEMSHSANSWGLQFSIQLWFGVSIYHPFDNIKASKSPFSYGIWWSISLGQNAVGGGDKVEETRWRRQGNWIRPEGLLETRCGRGLLTTMVDQCSGWGYSRTFLSAAGSLTHFWWDAHKQGKASNVWDV